MRGLMLGAAARTIAAVAFVGASGHAALAQSLYDRAENTPVTSRPHPAYDALGIHLGGFTAYPRVSLSGTYDDNVYGLPTKTSGFIFTVAPSVDFASNWTRHALDVNLRYEHDFYVEQSNESSDEYSLNSTGRIDIDHASALNFNLGLARLTEPRTAPDSFVGLRDPVRYDIVSAGAAIYREFNRLRFDATVGTATYSFFNTTLLDGTPFYEDSRDETLVNESVRGSYAVSPNFALFVQVSPNQSLFKHTPANGLTSFDSAGYALTGGINGQITHLMTADIGIGYYSQSYSDSRIGGSSGLAYNATIHYYPTQLVTVTGNASHNFAASALPGTPSSSVDSVDVRADYEFRRFLIISPDVNFARYSYPGLSRNDDRFGAAVSATYLVNRTIGVTASYGYIRQDSHGLGGVNFDDNRLSLTLTLQR